ncbi:MAG TPA: hypothetical protein VGZ22_12590 [Isosphaeraceae bacterium]|jgi:hypothetical protein|nr:hypothetical protein [Isosphaeraceae bacterium]
MVRSWRVGEVGRRGDALVGLAEVLAELADLGGEGVEAEGQRDQLVDRSGRWRVLGLGLGLGLVAIVMSGPSWLVKVGLDGR